MRQHITTIVVAATTAGVIAAGPAVARSVVDYARNADKVDGRHAVGSSASSGTRAGKLVATNSEGRLPNYIVRRVASADNAGTLDGLDSAAFKRLCDGIAAFASVGPNVGADYSPILGHQGAADSCAGTVEAKRVDTGIYRVRFKGLVTQVCDVLNVIPTPATLVSVSGPRDLFGTYEWIGEPNEEECRGSMFNRYSLPVQVTITDRLGAHTDALFTVAVLR